MLQNPYTQVQRNTYVPPNFNQNSIQWVQGIEGAKAFQLLPKSNAIMLDSENEGIFYIKVSDDAGMCNLRTFKFTEISNETPVKPNMDEYVKKSELEDILNRMLGGQTNEQSVQPVKSVKSTITQ